MHGSAAEMETVIALIVRLLDVVPKDWRAISDAWLELSVAGKSTDLEAIIDDWIGQAIQLRDERAVRSGIEALKVRLS